MANQLSTSYTDNLDSELKVQKKQTGASTIDTSYGGNTNATYGGHDAAWWQNQYNNQQDEESRNMVRKAADYYGYKIPENNMSGVSSPTTVNTLSYTPKQEQVAATVPPSQTYTTEPIDSYEEYLRKRADGYQESYHKTTQAIDDNKQTVIDKAELQRLETQRQAEIAREREIADARSSYEQNKATYGSNAEQLSEMGLTGSGYSDYIDAQAYATQRAEKQSANANAEATKQNAKYIADQAKLAAEQQANVDKLNAELKYAENMDKNNEDIAKYRQQKEDEAKAKAEQEEANKKAYFTELLGYANNGTFTAEQLSELGTTYGLSEEQIKQLSDSATTYKENKQNATYNEFLKNSDTSGFDTIKTALDNGEITQGQYDNLVTSYQKYYYDIYTSSIESDFSSANTGDIDNAYERGYITEDQYLKLKEKYNAGVLSAVTAASIFYSNGVALSKEQAQDLSNKLDKLRESGWITEDTDAKIDEKFDSTYNSDDGGSCVAKGTEILLPNGQVAPIETLSVGDSVLSFDHINGTCVETKVAFTYCENTKVKVIKLNFTDNVSIELLNTGHGLFDRTLDKYVLITPDNVNQYIGHTFAYLGIVEGQIMTSKVILESCLISESLVERYDIVTENKLNHIANGLLACSDVLVGISNMFEFNNLLCDKAKVDEDIEKYGIYSYDEWAEYVSKEDFDTFNGAYFKIAVEKGLLTIEELFELIGFIKTQWENMSKSE